MIYWHKIIPLKKSKKKKNYLKICNKKMNFKIFKTLFRVNPTNNNKNLINNWNLPIKEIKLYFGTLVSGEQESPNHLEEN